MQLPWLPHRRPSLQASASASGLVAGPSSVPHHPLCCGHFAPRPFRRHRPGAGWTPNVRLQAVESVASLSERETETKREAYERRLKESQRVEERVRPVFSSEEFHTALEQAGKKLVVLEVDSPTVCQTGLKEEPEIHWKQDQPDTQAPCRELKHLLQRTARDCPDVQFVHLDADAEGGKEACRQLGVDVLPTLQFWREGSKLWEHRGILHLQQDLGEGVLYYGDSAAHGLKASTYVHELYSRADFERFVDNQDSKVLTVVDVSLQRAAPCIRIFAAVLALARSFQGYARFARLLGDASPDGSDIMQEYGVREVPTFLFFRNGKEVGRHVGSSRGDLIGQILLQQNALGIAPPPPPVRATRTKRV